MSKSMFRSRLGTDQCGFFMEIPASNIDTRNLVCNEPIEGDIHKMHALDFRLLVVRRQGPHNFLLLDGICQLRKQLAIGKKRVLAIDENLLAYPYLVAGRPHGKVHILEQAYQTRSLLVDPGLDDFQIGRIFHTHSYEVQDYLSLTLLDILEQGVLIRRYSSAQIKKGFLIPLVAAKRRLLRKLFPGN